MPSMWRFCAPLSKMPGRMLLIVTLRWTVCRARPATKPTRPARAPFDRPSSSCGIFTLRDEILMMRPKPRAIMPSTVKRIISIGASIIASSASIQVSRVQLRKSPGVGPSALFSRMSGSGQAASAAPRPASVVISAAVAVTRTPVAARISPAVRSSTSRLRATMVTSTPSFATAMAAALPNPRLAPQRSAFLPRMPRSICLDLEDALDVRREHLVERHLAMRDALLIGKGEERLQRLAIGLDAVRPEILAKHHGRAAGIVGIPRQREVRDHHVADAREAAVLRFLEGAIEVHCNPGIALEQRPLDRDKMHDREDAGAVEVFGLDLDVIGYQPHHIGVAGNETLGRDGGEDGVDLAGEQHVVERLVRDAHALDGCRKVELEVLMAAWFVGPRLNP